MRKDALEGYETHARDVAGVILNGNESDETPVVDQEVTAERRTKSPVVGFQP